MENYIYETSGGHIGYFQIEDGKCRFFPYNYPANYIDGGDWKTYFNLLKAASPDPDSFVISQDMIHEAMTRHISQSGRISTHKVIKTLRVDDAGSYYPRINRGEPGLSAHQINSNERADEIRSFDNIIESLLDIFRTIEPESGNFLAYGNRLRELLIVSCTEVEYLLQRSVVENGRRPQKKNYSTADYFWCLSIQRLNEYSVELPAYPTLGKFSPFKNWSAPNYTQSLPWYDAYNKVKHDRGGTKHLATFESLINSIAAIHILLEAQYGKEIFEYRFQYTFRTIFYSSARPIWKADEICTPILHSDLKEWKKIKMES